jgi:hypothetical protein
MVSAPGQANPRSGVRVKVHASRMGDALPPSRQGAILRRAISLPAGSQSITRSDSTRPAMVAASGSSTPARCAGARGFEPEPIRL